ncbi:hypothetical protein ACFP2F_21620 [Hymenobacter artigasi]|uniref:Lipocalin-like domain-containing protein n=1 Tax=Hymenobacter artigasi TaxID=2719616 RepID=A0ABX1HRD3_9BACT|nr:hypothetical protein [Hymenobacter artigasi]NKI91867.1 hypothetical protein [Hymenobacter artigasi]
MRSPALFLLLLFALGACKPTGPSPSTPTALLTAHPWHVVALTTTTGGRTTDRYADIPSCSRDNRLQFYTDHRLVTDEGASRCAATDPQQQTGQWQWAAGETQLTGSVPYLPYLLASTLTVRELSPSSLRLRYQETNSPDFADLTFEAD